MKNRNVKSSGGIMTSIRSDSAIPSISTASAFIRRPQLAIPWASYVAIFCFIILVTVDASTHLPASLSARAEQQKQQLQERHGSSNLAVPTKLIRQRQVKDAAITDRGTKKPKTATTDKNETGDAKGADVVDDTEEGGATKEDNRATTDPPTKAPTASATNEDSNHSNNKGTDATDATDAPTEAPTNSPTDDYCTAASSCEACRTANDKLQTSGKICWWGDNQCSQVDKDDELDVDTMCLTELPTKAPSASPTPATTTRPPTISPTATRVTPSLTNAPTITPKTQITDPPTSTPVDAPPTLLPEEPKPTAAANNEASYEDDYYSMNPVQDFLISNGMTIGMGLVVLCALCTILRRLCCRAGGQGHLGSSQRAAYQGLSSADSDDEWGWDGDDDNDVKFSPPKSMELPIHRPHEAPATKARESPQTTAPPSVRGMSLKGVKAQPLTQRPSQASKARQPAAPLPKTLPAAAPIVNRTKSDDFFAEMGLSENPSSRTTTATSTSANRWKGSSMGATPLPSGTSDLGDDDNWNDDDLDDLLND
ncbi:hypothetical protein MPSEU_000533200 [Mayamaea pseudoterrestris]|nr:hypothetical protein MPSEU_000533200 [Mayamaea pseudoterrestris]